MLYPKTFNPRELHAKTVLVRVDLNLPRQGGQVLDTTRLDRIVPTLKTLLDQHVKVIILSHVGRPKGQCNKEDSLAFLKPLLENRLERAVHFCPKLDEESLRQAVEHTSLSSCVLLENLRFDPGEEANDPAFAERLAKLGDAYVNDAFSVSHRAHASVDAITKFLPSYAGLLMYEELSALQKGFLEAQKPIMAIIGGSKVSTKFQLLGNLVTKVQVLVLGGGIAHTFMAAQGTPVGQSPIEPALYPEVQKIKERAAAADCRIYLPEDVQVQSQAHQQIYTRHLETEQIAENDIAYDVGPETCATIGRLLQEVKTVIWNGPVGFFEKPPFDRGSFSVAKNIAEATQSGQLYSLAGGGETAAVLNQAGVMSQVSYVSTGGGAFLEFLEGKDLPGVQALLEDNQSHQTCQNTSCLM